MQPKCSIKNVGLGFSHMQLHTNILIFLTDYKYVITDM